MTHDTVAVQLFVSKLISFLKNSIDLKTIIFMSDGAVAHYKNRKNFAALCNFQSIHKIEAEWHFFATSHGKGPCDAIGGTLKRTAKWASFAREDGFTIKTPLELYNWAIKQSDENITKLNFSFTSNDEYVNMSDKLENIFNNAKTLAGTHK